jgi:membrane protein YqaA with SNARE-associated domain
MLLELSVYGSLFFTAFLAATFFPAQSEILLVSLLLAGGYPPWTLVFVASAGNTMGSMLNWLIGFRFMHLLNTKWFGQETEALQKAQRWYHKYGRWSLLMSWAPIVGDPLTLVAGMLKEPFRPVLAIVLFAKTARYIIVAVLTLQGGAYAGSIG